MISKWYATRVEKLNATRALTKLIRVWEEFNFHDKVDFTANSIHCAINRHPAVEATISVFLQQQWIEAQADFADGIVGRIRVMVLKKDVWTSAKDECNYFIYESQSRKFTITRKSINSSWTSWSSISKRNHCELNVGFSVFLLTSVLWVTFPSLISTYASVVSLPRSITGRLLKIDN